MAAAEALAIARGIDDNVKDVDERVKSVDMKIECMDDKVQGVDHKVCSVIQGVLYFHSLPPELSLAFYSVRRNGDQSSDSTGVHSSQRPQLFVIFSLHHHRSCKPDLSYRE